jgi:hypothetical protein
LPFNDPANTNPVTVNTPGNANERVSYLGFTPGGAASTGTLGDARYTSLQASLRHQFSHGLLLQAAYTLSRNMTNVQSAEAGTGINPPGEDLFGASNSNNPLDLQQQYGPATWNRPQRFVISYSYDLPWKSTSGWYSKVLGGWTWSGVVTIQNGEPITITDGDGGSIYGAGTSRAELIDPVNCNSMGVCQSGIPVATSGSTESRVNNGWINPAAFGTAPNGNGPPCIGGPTAGPCVTTFQTSLQYPFGGPAGTGWGNSGVGIVSGPGQNNWDMALMKRIKLNERLNMQFRAEAFNIWNHPQFNNPAGTNVETTTGSSAFGMITSTSTTPRVWQFALKVLF